MMYVLHINQFGEGAVLLSLCLVLFVFFNTVTYWN